MAIGASNPELGSKRPLAFARTSVRKQHPCAAAPRFGDKDQISSTLRSPFSWQQTRSATRPNAPINGWHDGVSRDNQLALSGAFADT
jgi:hypothetical protein